LRPQKFLSEISFGRTCVHCVRLGASLVHMCASVSGVRVCCLVGMIGPYVAEERAPAVQGGGGHAQDTAASQHRSLLRLLRGAAVTRQTSHRPCHRTHDIRNSQDVRTTE